MANRFVAEIRLLATAEDGRERPLPPGEWRPVLDVNGRKWSARLLFTGQPAPGECFVAEVGFYSPEAAQEFFTPGIEFTVWEAGIKGRGQVTSLLPESNA